MVLFADVPELAMFVIVPLDPGVVDPITEAAPEACVTWIV
jgi:hypothetical protein